MSDYDVSNFERPAHLLASAEDIRSWSHGEVKKAETINYRTLKPEKDGLFCEKIFGPTKDWECACGKYKRVRFKGIVCERCGVEVTRSKVRRERMGHIELAAPVSHIWYFKGSPSRLGYLLDIAPKELEKVLYFASSIVTWVDTEARDEDVEELRDELAADLEELDAERDRLIEATRRLSTEYVPEDDEFADEIDDDERMEPEEVEAEIADIYDEYNERKALRTEAFDAFLKIVPKQLVPDEALYREMRMNYSDYFRGGMGAEAVRDLLDDMDLEAVAEELKDTIENGKGQKRAKAIKRLKVVDAFMKSDNKPSDMILDVIPVIPPDLRPMVQLDGGRFATSDLNDLYRRVINRNNRLKRLLDLGAPEIIVNNEKRMLQEAVDSLFDNGRRGRPVAGPGNRPLKSLSDMLKGKQGRFRQNLLGKRVDYSGRSVIVVGPRAEDSPVRPAAADGSGAVQALRYEAPGRARVRRQHQGCQARCRPWCKLRVGRPRRGHHRPPRAAEPRTYPAPLWASRPSSPCSSRARPSSCTRWFALRSTPTSTVTRWLCMCRWAYEAQAEARVLMLSANNIKSPAHGRPLTIPTQDMIIGMYFLTTVRDGFPGEGRVFASVKDALDEFEAGTGVDIQARISVRATRDMQIAKSFSDFETVKAGERFETSIGRIIFNNVLPEDHQFVNYVVNKKEIGRLIEECSNRYDVSDMPAILDGLKNAGYHYATKAGITVSVFDATMPPNKAELLAAADAKVDAIDEDYEMGLMSPEERHKQVVDIWNDTTEEIGEAMAANFDQYNPIYMMADSGARGNIKQIRQLAGMRGLMGNTKGGTIDRPVKSNFREGLSVLEYFISTHGTRKGMTDTALRTADSGYLTRRLVDVAQDVIVREIDCGTPEGVPYPLHNEKGEIDENLIGRCLLEDTGDLLAGDYITSMDQLKAFEAAGIDTVVIRTVMTCHAEHGVCQKCYGWDLATGRPVNIGTAVGIIAAQSIGEPGTQLTMRTFHAGGVAAADDITRRSAACYRSFSRLASLRARLCSPNITQVPCDDYARRQDNGKTRTVIIALPRARTFREYVDSGACADAQSLASSTAAHVKVGQQLTEGSVEPARLAALRPTRTPRCATSSTQVQDVYVSQGVDINDKHIEVIARQMLRKVVVMEAGDSELLPGRQVNRHEFERVANRTHCRRQAARPWASPCCSASPRLRWLPIRSCRPRRSRRPPRFSPTPRSKARPTFSPA